MRVKNGFLVAACLGLTVTIAQVSARQAPAPTPAPAGAPQGGGGGGRGGRGGGPAAPAGAPAQGGGNRQATFPAGQRPPDDPAIVARGKTLYEANCQLCHGRDLRGGDNGGPNLLRSEITLEDKMGELFLPIVKTGRGKMAALPNLSDDDIKAVALHVHAIAATMTGQGGPPRGNPMPPAEAVLVGDVAAGRAYVQAKCLTCHSVTGDLQGIGNRYPDPRTLQSSWVAGSAGGGRGG